MESPFTSLAQQIMEAVAAEMRQQVDQEGLDPMLPIELKQRWIKHMETLSRNNAGNELTLAPVVGAGQSYMPAQYAVAATVQGAAEPQLRRGCVRQDETPGLRGTDLYYSGGAQSAAQIAAAQIAARGQPALYMDPPGRGYL